MRNAVWTILVIAVLAACAPRETGGGETSGVPPGAVFSAGLRAVEEEFDLGKHREIGVVYSLRNISREVARLRFPTAQNLEVSMRGPDGRPLFLWSEDRVFTTTPSSVVVNPGERLEFSAGIPTRDMVAGRLYAVEAVLPGYPETSAAVSLRPR